MSNIMNLLSEYRQLFTSPSSMDLAFNVASQVAMLGWVAITLFPSSYATHVAVRFSVFFNSILYAFFVLDIFNPGPPDFLTWQGVLSFLRNGPDAGLLAAWIHYLAFDLVAGYYIALDASKNGISRFVVAPFLGLTLMFGPFGFLLWALSRGFLGSKNSWLSF